MNRRFNTNDRVILVPFEANPAEEATVIELEGGRMYLVSIDRAYREDDDPDGLREVEEKQMVEHTEENLKTYGLLKQGKKASAPHVRRKR